MSIVVRFAPPSPAPAAQYDETIRRLEGDGGDFPPDGLEYHIAFLVDGGIRVSEIWDSREKWEAFEATGIPGQMGTPTKELYEVVNYLT